jgi:hypothetical protein
LKIIADSVEKIYNEIYSFLDKYLTSDIYMKIMKEIDKIDIVPLSKKDILYRLLSDVKKKPKVYRSSKKKISLFSPEDNIKPEIDVPKPKDSQEFSTISNIFDTKYICQPIEKTNTILVYDVINKTLFTQKFESNLFISEIPSFCAWLNYKNNLYISGGEINGKISKNLLKYDSFLDFPPGVPLSSSFPAFLHSTCDCTSKVRRPGALRNTPAVLRF